ncbi:MAG: nucleoside hydrolase [Candidatus Promineifilaceae bacterium]
MSSPTFPKLSDKERACMLALPDGPVRLIIDTDTKNEIDDQFALAWALLSPDRLQIEAVYAEPFSSEFRREAMIETYELIQAEKPVPPLLDRYIALLNGLVGPGEHPKDLLYDGPDIGMELSYQEILTVYEKLRLDPEGLVFRGSERYLTSFDDPVESPAALDLVERAMKAGDEPLYVSAIGCVTNVASAILMEPEIIRKIVVIWTAGYPSTVDLINYSFNMEQDMLSSQLLFESGVPLVYLPGHHVGAQLRMSLPELETWVRGRGAIGDFLYSLYVDNPGYKKRGITDHFGRSWVMWDLINFAWLIDPRWVPSEMVRTPKLGNDKVWHRDPGYPWRMREGYGVNRDAIMRDFLEKLKKAPA